MMSEPRIAALRRLERGSDMKFIEAFMDKEASNGREWTDGHHVYGGK